MKTFITHKKLRKLLETFQIENRFSKLLITHASQRFRFNEEGKDEKIVPMVSWPKMDLGEAFNWVYQNNGWFQSLRRLNKVSISVLHGNPYIHLSVIDYFDGSTFDLWVLNSRQLFIVPQMRGSVFSIKRLINHIFDSYTEGDIKDYQGSIN